MQTNGSPVENIPTIRLIDVDEARAWRSSAPLRPEVSQLRDDVARLRHERDELRAEIAELQRVRDGLQAAGGPPVSRPLADLTSHDAPAPLRELRLSLDLPSDDDEVAAAFERFFETEFEHDKSRDWILSDPDPR